jgi:hypothetical protein
MYVQVLYDYFVKTLPLIPLLTLIIKNLCLQILYNSCHDTLMFTEKLESVSLSLEMIRIAELFYSLVLEKCLVLVSNIYMTHKLP